MLRVLLLLVAVFLFPLARGASQTRQAGPSSRLRPGQTVRIRLPDGQRVEGRLAAVDTAPPVLHFDESQASIALAAIDSLWLRGSRAGTGALVGGILGGGGSFAFWTLLCYGLSESGRCNEWGTVIGLSAAGAFGGVLLGTVLGSLVLRWKLLKPGPVSMSFGPVHRGAMIVAQLQF